MLDNVLTSDLPNPLNHPIEDKVFPNKYEEHFYLSTNEDTREKFWAEQAQLIDWYKEPEEILDDSNPPFYKWFKGGMLNTCYNCVDRHAEKHPDRTAFIYESAMTGVRAKYTFAELKDYVSKFAGVLKKHGVQKGDRVIIYMPMIPEAAFAILATARLGAIHSVVFGGFSGTELASRIKDAEPKVLIYASCGIEPHGIVDYKKNVEEALTILDRKDLTRIVRVREQYKIELDKDYEFDFYEELKSASPEDCVPVESTDYLYILYTSGTTGTPKGIVRDNGGNAVALAYTMKYIFDIHPGDVYFSGSDIGWVVGHSYTIYGPLIAGAATVMYEGKPVGTPDAGVLWRICERYNVRGMYSAPTALRVVRREDPNGKFMKECNLKNLNMISIAGERLDTTTFAWLHDHLPEHVIVNDNYWQTETAWSIGTNFVNLHTFKSKPGSCTKPAPGNLVEIMGEDGKPVPNGTLGKVCIKLPMPPSFMSTLYKNDQAFVEKYMTTVPGYYFTGDAGMFDQDGYLHITTRVDDIINTAGHRLSTSQIEEVLTSHPDINEAAVIGVRDEVKGEIPVGFVVLKKDVFTYRSEIEKQCIQKVRHDIGPVASFKHCVIVEKLPKTRSGKTLRSVLRAMMNGIPPKIPPTIEDITVIEQIKQTIVQLGFGTSADFEYQQEIDYKQELLSP